MLPLQGAICIVAFLSQGVGLSLSKAVAIGPGYAGPSARGIALNGQQKIEKYPIMNDQYRISNNADRRDLAPSPVGRAGVGL